jgi:hypothetical protein
LYIGHLTLFIFSLSNIRHLNLSSYNDIYKSV